MHDPDPPILGDSNDNENETLGQRLRRLKATQIPLQPRPVSGDFASEMMSQFGGPSPAEQPPQVQAAPHNPTKTPDPEETLGQRRKRLQAEASQARQVSAESSNPAPQPPMSKRRSMADILQAHPAAGAGNTVRALSHEIKFAPAPKTRNTPWAINQTRQASIGAGLPMASGLGTPNDVYGNGHVGGGGGYFPHPMVQKPIEVDNGRREMIDRWRQSVHY